MFLIQGEQTTDSNNNLSDWWNFQWETYMSALFHPMASLTRPMARQDDLEVRLVLSKVASGGGVGVLAEDIYFMLITTTL